MGDRAPEQLEAACVRVLRELRLTEYESHVFVSLIRLGTGTAKDVADVSEVPRTGVYDAVDTLHDAGLVDIQYTSPRKFTTVSRETAIRKLDLERRNTITELRELLENLEPTKPQSEEFGVWTVTGHEAVASRVFEFFEDAEDEIVYMTVDEVLTDEHVASLKAAADRGVDIYVAGISDPVQVRIQDAIPSATLFETLWDWSESGAGSLLVVDQRSALVSVLLRENGFDETAIWGQGDRNSLVLVLRTIFTWRLGDRASG